MCPCFYDFSILFLMLGVSNVPLFLWLFYFVFDFMCIKCALVSMTFLFYFWTVSMVLYLFLFYVLYSFGKWSHFLFGSSTIFLSKYCCGCQIVHLISFSDCFKLTMNRTRVMLLFDGLLCSDVGNCDNLVDSRSWVKQNTTFFYRLWLIVYFHLWDDIPSHYHCKV